MKENMKYKIENKYSNLFNILLIVIILNLMIAFIYSVPHFKEEYNYFLGLLTIIVFGWDIAVIIYHFKRE